jgi:hypothetical protein
MPMPCTAPVHVPQIYFTEHPDVGSDVGITADDSHLSYLTLAHIYERVMLETASAVGARIGFWQVPLPQGLLPCAPCPAMP